MEIQPFEESRILRPKRKWNEHLLPQDATMLSAYAIATAKVFALARENDVRAWEAVCRVMMALGTKLRITVQACARPDTLGKARTKGPRLRVPWAGYDLDLDAKEEGAAEDA
jgi:hypothetical protein